VGRGERDQENEVKKMHPVRKTRLPTFKNAMLARYLTK